MYTIFKALLEGVTGSVSMVFFIVVFMIMSMGIFLVWRKNRNKRSILKYLFVELGILELCDYFWFTYFFSQGQYVNRGMRGIWIILIYPVAIIMAHVFLLVGHFLQGSKGEKNKNE